jgi:arginase
LAMGTISGTAAVYPGLGVIWVDAHAGIYYRSLTRLIKDINTPESSDSGNLHGCPAAFLSGLAGEVKHFEWLDTKSLDLSRLVYIGLRDIGTTLLQTKDKQTRLKR